MDEMTILKAIPSTKEASFNEFVNGLGSDKPTDRDEWRVLFLQLERLEADGLVEIERLGDRIDTLILTTEGADKVREANRR